MKDNLTEIIQKKNENNIIKIKLGKITSDSNFNYKLDLKQFENILEKIKHNNTQSSIEYKKYNKYYDRNRIYILYSNNYEEYITNLNTISEIFPRKKGIDLELNITTYRRLNRELFHVKYDYDRVINVESIIFNYETFTIECNKIKEKEIYYEIYFNIKNANAKIDNILNFC